MVQVPFPINIYLRTKALRIPKDTIRHTGERYEVGLMLKNPEINLPDNADVAFRHFSSPERRA